MRRLIDADALKKHAYMEHIPGDDYLVVEWSDIEDAPTVDAVEVVHGKWLRGAMQEPSRLLCTNCDWDGPDYVKWYSYCPNCGAKMEAMI